MINYHGNDEMKVINVDYDPVNHQIYANTDIGLEFIMRPDELLPYEIRNHQLIKIDPMRSAAIALGLV